MKPKIPLPPCFSPSTLKTVSSTNFSLRGRVKQIFIEMTDQVPLPCTPLNPKLFEEMTSWDYRIEIDPQVVLKKIEQETRSAEEFDQNPNPNFPPKHLSLPFITIESFSFSQFLESGLATAKGLREQMEDAHLVEKIQLHCGGKTKNLMVTGIFDGHCGKLASRFVADKITDKIKKRLEQYNQGEMTDIGVWNALKLAFVDVSRSFVEDGSGTTANVCLWMGKTLWTANAGDSRAILVSPQGEIVILSEDAKPLYPPYNQEIEHRGGIVIGGRVMGDLNVARSLGDHRLKGVISPRPKITKHSQLPKGSILIQCCDGIFDVANSFQVGKFVLTMIQKGNDCEMAARLLVQAAWQAKSTDNLSALITKL